MSSQASKAIRHLATHGWINLRSMSFLLGYAHPTGIYGRQRGKNPIPTVKMGGTHRVYKDDVIETLKNVPEEDQDAAQVFLMMYRAALKEQQNVAP